MGTAGFAIPSLNILLENGYTVQAVVTVPDQPAGRGRRLSESSVKSFAFSKGLPLLQPQSLRDEKFLAALEALAIDIIVVVAFRILPPAVIRMARVGAFNVHASLLPKYRGAAPIQRAIMNGERETGVTTFLLEEKVDTGSVLLQARTPVGNEETAAEVHDRLSQIGAELALHTVRLMHLGRISPRPQDHALATPAPKIFKDDCHIDWTRPAADVHNHIRALSPKPGAFTFHNGAQLKIFRSAIAPNDACEHPGMILSADSELVVAAGAGSVRVLEIQQEGKKVMVVQEFLRGYDVSVGEELK